MQFLGELLDAGMFKQVGQREIVPKFIGHAINDLHAGNGITAECIEIVIRFNSVISKRFCPDFTDGCFRIADIDRGVGKCRCRRRD